MGRSAILKRAFLLLWPVLACARPRGDVSSPKYTTVCRSDELDWYVDMFGETPCECLAHPVAIVPRIAWKIRHDLRKAGERL